MKKNRVKKILVLLTASMVLTGCGQTAATYNEQGNVSQSETGENKDAGENTEVIEEATDTTEEATEITEEVVETTEEVSEEVETTEEAKEAKEVKAGAYDEKEFFDYVNAKRTEAGLGTFEWSDEVAEQAKAYIKALYEEGKEPGKLEYMAWSSIGGTGEFISDLYKDCLNKNYDSMMFKVPSNMYTEGDGAVVSYYDENGSFMVFSLLSIKDAYSYEDIDSAKYYASNSVNVRDLPSTDGEKIASLAKGEEVTVTGKCNETGWYRIADSKGGIGYVSDSYLSTEKPVIQVAENTAPQNPQPSTPEQPQPEQSAPSVDEYTGNSEEDFWNWLLAQADSGNIQKGYTVSDSDGAWSEARIDKDFVNYLNEQRVAAGLNALEWASDLEEIVKQRAVETIAEYASGTAHAGKPSDCGENQLATSGNYNVQQFYDVWYASPVHYANMFNSSYTRAAYAVYYNDADGEYYAVTLFQ